MCKCNCTCNGLFLAREESVTSIDQTTEEELITTEATYILLLQGMCTYLKCQKWSSYKERFLHLFVQKSRQMTHPVLTRALGCTHLVSCPDHFLPSGKIVQRVQSGNETSTHLVSCPGYFLPSWYSLVLYRFGSNNLKSP